MKSLRLRIVNCRPRIAHPPWRYARTACRLCGGL